ncbi:Athe_2463 domain-containing protein [Cohnella yongneupensis]|uniref:Athe_2463 domain-containing protein n=1 Tax=Cohnella yongneupensis TaxID=425006 RepID=A0ABW0R5M5_9BACL
MIGRRGRRDRYITFTLLLGFLASILSVVAQPISAATTDNVVDCNAGHTELKPPPGFDRCILVSGKTKLFNQKLYDETKLVAYGKLAEVNLKSTDFKSRWLDLEGEEHPNTYEKLEGDNPPVKHPYYKSSDTGEKGEYRYHGYDRNGNLYANNNFPRDGGAASNVDPEDKMWIYRPWDSTVIPSSNKNKPSGFSPLKLFGNNLTDAKDIYSKGQNTIDAVNKIIHVNNFNGGIIETKNDYPKDPEGNKTKRNLFDYMYVEQTPSTWAGGQGRMLNQRSDGSIWYQEFAIDRLKSSSKKKPGMKSTTVKPTKTLNEKWVISSTASQTQVDLRTAPENWKWSFDFSSIINDDRKVDPSDDDVMFKDRFRKLEYYTRSDVNYWQFTITYNIAGKTPIVNTYKTDQNGKVIFDNDRQIGRFTDSAITFNKNDFSIDDQVFIQLHAETHYESENVAMTFDKGDASYTIYFKDTVPIFVPDLPHRVITDPDPALPPLLSCAATIPKDAFDIVSYGASDQTDASKVQSRKVFLDGRLISDADFFSGNYVFGDDLDGIHQIMVQWVPFPTNDPRIEDPAGYDPGCQSVRYVYVHDTVPTAQFLLKGGSFKENRKMTVDDTSAQAVDAYVQATYPLVDWQWSWSALGESSDADRRLKVNQAQHKEFLYKQPGRYQLTLTVKNALGRTSEAYVLPFSVLRDENPAVIFYPYSSEISREDALTPSYDAVSTDGDVISNQSFKVYYDSAGDETYTQLIDSFTSPVPQYKPPISKLGKYRIVVMVNENYGQDTFPEYLTAADKRQTTKQFEFEINNYIPYSDIYTDIPTKQEQVDTYFLADKNLAQAKIDYLKSNGVTINNELRKEGIDPYVSLWDMHTYTYTQPASTTNVTGQSYPPTSTNYCNNGYCGVLTRSSITDNGSNQDFGSDKLKDMSDTQTKEAVCTNTQNVSYDKDGHGTESFTGSCGDSYAYDSGGYKGSLSRTYTSPSSGCPSTDTSRKNGSCSTLYTAHYSGSATRTWQESYHEYDWRWVSNYYGYYSGTISKDVRQLLTNPFSRTTSTKYVIYISDGIVNELADFNQVKGLSDARVILVGTSGIQSQSSPADYIANTGQPIEAIVQSVVDLIASRNPPTATQTVQVNEAFTLLTDEKDPELDPIIQKQTMYVHNENFYDNPTGHAAFAKAAYDPTGWSAETLKTSFAYPGEYTIYRRVKDQPSTDPKLAQYSYYSNEAETVIRVHRKPFALATLDWTYNMGCSCYKTTWVDKSYDLDHNVSDPVARGIVERKIRYQFNGEWYYKIPDELQPGSYHLEYTVKDVEGAWSDPFGLDFVLAATPPPQLKAKLKATDSTFTIAGGVPASESVTGYELWTRFPLSVNLQFLMGSYINKTVSYFTGTMSGSDISWDDYTTAIPATTPDGTYNYRIQANGVNGTSAYQDFSMKVLTPINLVPRVDSATATDVTDIVTKDPITIRAITTEYPNQTIVKLFKGTSYQQSISLTGTVTATTGVGSKTWVSAAYTVPTIPDGNYTFEWTSRTPNGNVQVVSKVIHVINNRPPTGDFSWSPSPVYEGDMVQFSTAVDDPDQDALQVAYEITSPTGTRQSYNYQRNAPYLQHSGPSLRMLTPGLWTVSMTVSDGTAPPVSIMKTIRVEALSVIGTVKHTPEWESNRQVYNSKHNPDRSADTFWAGEAFVLEAGTTDTGASSTKAVSVTVSMFDGNAKTLSANDAVRRTSWSGILRSADTNIDFLQLEDGAYTFVFTATYSNGTVKTDAVTITISDQVYAFVRVHRLQ